MFGVLGLTEDRLLPPPSSSSTSDLSNTETTHNRCGGGWGWTEGEIIEAQYISVISQCDDGDDGDGDHFQTEVPKP